MCLDPMNAPSYEIARLGIQVRLARVLAFRLKGVGKCDGTSSQDAAVNTAGQNVTAIASDSILVHFGFEGM